MMMRSTLTGACAAAALGLVSADDAGAQSPPPALPERLPEQLIYAQPGTNHLVDAPRGVTAVQVVAVGGRGGGDTGGAGGIVTATVPVAAGKRIISRVAVNGTVATDALGPMRLRSGQGGAGGGPGAGAGGGSSYVTIATTPTQVISAAGGGGAGAAAFGAPGGAGGAAGSAGAAGVGSDAVRAATGGGGGSLTTIGAPGTGTMPLDPLCPSGLAGGKRPGLTLGLLPGVPRISPQRDQPSSLTGSAGPAAAGGGAGTGFRPGGPGGGAAACGSTPLSGAGGGGGASSGPPGATIAHDTSGTPSVTLTWIHETTAPRIVISFPREGAVIAPGALRHIRYRCRDEDGGSGVVACEGSLPTGTRIDSSASGRFTLVVRARDRWGNEADERVVYIVADRVAPRLSHLSFPARLSRPGKARLRFRSSEPMTVRVALERRLLGRAARWRRTGRQVVAARAGWNAVRVTDGPPVAGSYRLTVTGRDDAGNRAAPVTRRFAVVPVRNSG